MTARLVAKDKDPRGGTFERKAFSVSRLAEFASLPELTKQIGQPVENWALVVFKELTDNALDEAERAGGAPVVEVVVASDSITIADQGRGIKPAVVRALTDYNFKTSSNAAVVSPTRGQQRLSLPLRPTKRSDSRASKFEAEFGRGSVELDPIHPDELRRIVSEAIEQHVDQSQLAVAKVAERSEREMLRMFASDVRAGRMNGKGGTA